MNELEAGWTGERLEPFVYSENTNEHLHRYAMAMELAVGKKVLDIASGEGYGSALLAGLADEVVGVDIAPETILLASQRYKADNLRFLTGAADAIPWEDHYFDLVVSFETIEHHDRHEEMMRELRRVLKPGGLLLISSPDKRYYSDLPGYRNPFHVKELYQHEFESLLSSHFAETSFLKQKSIYGSVVVPLKDENPSNDFIPAYKGDYAAIRSAEMEAVYLIGLASDAPLPKLKTSLFDGAAVLQKQFELLSRNVTDVVTAAVAARVTHEVTEKVSREVSERVERETTKKMMETRSYKIGNRLIRPFVALKKILHA